jgi:hypothetical protein
MAGTMQSGLVIARTSRIPQTAFRSRVTAWPDNDCDRRFLLKAGHFRLDRKCRPGVTLTLLDQLALAWHARSIFSDWSLNARNFPHFCVFRPLRSTGNARLPRCHRLTPRQIRHRHHPPHFHCANLHRDRNLQQYLVVSRRPRQREWQHSSSTRSWFMPVSYLASAERKVDNDASVMIRIAVAGALDQYAPATRQRGNGSRARLVFQ